MSTDTQCCTATKIKHQPNSSFTFSAFKEKGGEKKKKETLPFPASTWDRLWSANGILQYSEQV
jgi:hypothetical protein